MPVQFTKDPLPTKNQGERHIPAVLLVDTSGSMSGAPIEELNRGLREFGNALQEDSLALGRAEVCIISFNSSVETEMGFRPAVDYEAPTLSASGLTSFNEAIQAGLDAIESIRVSPITDRGCLFSQTALRQIPVLRLLQRADFRMRSETRR